MKTKNNKTSFIRHGLAIGAVLYMLVTGCTTSDGCGDLIISAVSVSNLTPDAATFDIDFMNVNSGPVTLYTPGLPHSPDIEDNPFYVIVLSMDAVFTNDDQSLGGASIVNQDVVLYGGQKTTTHGSFDLANTNLPRSVNTTSYPYLIIKTGGPVINDCNLHNNVFILNLRTNTQAN